MADDSQPDLFGSGTRRVEPLGNRSLDELLAYLDVQLDHCDDTFKLTRAWAQQRGLAPAHVVGLAWHDGAKCDCQVAEYAGLLGSWGR